MKTNQNMIRTMGEFKVTQRTRDGFFNATELLRQWNNSIENQQLSNTHKIGDLKRKDLDDYFNLKGSRIFIDEIIKRENLNNRNSCYLTSRGKYGGTWMHPLLFVDFAMWLNPSFKYDVLKFVYDQMIQYRNDAGDAYRELGSAVGKIVTKDFMPKAMKKIGEALNWIIFNSHEKELRNKHGNEDKQRELYEFEHKVANLINEGFIKDYPRLISYLRNQYSTMHNPI